MKTTNISGMHPRRELCSVEVKRFQGDGILPTLGRRPWSTGEGSGIIESNQETITVRWGPGNH